MPQPSFHPIIRRWFATRFTQPTEPQQQGWPVIAAGRHTLIAAPTGSGKTLTAFLVCIDRLLREELEGRLGSGTRVLYVSPLKALSNDIRRNLEVPLTEIINAAADDGHKGVTIRAAVRTGDTPAATRQAMLKRPPHILVTTPESLYLLLTSPKSREILRTVETVIVDEIHAIARDKRGSHLSLSLERLDALCPAPPQRIGLSATQKPIEAVARYLVGQKNIKPSGKANCEIINVGHSRTLDLGVEVPTSELSAVCSNEQWEEIYSRLKELVASHRSTLIFVNTRKLAERVAFHLSHHLGEEKVASHHGSLSRERRLIAEEKLKTGELQVIVATASLELGIDVGYIDLVCQIGSPRSIATFLQRIGRSGHSLSLTPKGRLFALTRDELAEAFALIRSIRQGHLDQLEIPVAPLDILAQQLVASVAADEEWEEEALYQMVRGSWPYRDLSRETFEQVLAMLANGYATDRRKTAWLFRDQIAGKVKARRGARLSSMTSGGAIPEQAEFRVVTEGDNAFVGTLNEDFAIESHAGDIFLLGNTSWQIVHIRGGEVVVRDMHGAPPTIPFWLGEAPGRTHELSKAVSLLREELAAMIDVQTNSDDPLYKLETLTEIKAIDPPAYRQARDFLIRECAADEWSSLQIVHYVAVEKLALGLVPSCQNIVFERFFDDTGGMQLVIHSPYGLRINRGFGLALRKRFCRSFDFELQASADDDGIVLSLGPHQSFPIEQLFSMLNPENVQGLLEQALLAVPLFQVRWRWNTTRSLAVLRSQNGKRTPPALQRFRADDLLTAIFPAQTQCKEHVTGDIPLPDHPLVNQTMFDCLNEAIDISGLKELLEEIRSGGVTLIARDTREPSPFSYQLLNANPYAFLDDAPLEERRARAVFTRRTLPASELRDLAKLDAQAIEKVARMAFPEVRDADELHDQLLNLGVFPEADAHIYREFFNELIDHGRAVTVTVDTQTLWAAAESLSLLKAAYREPSIVPDVRLDPKLLTEIEPEQAWHKLVKGYIEIKGIISAAEIAAALALQLWQVEATLPVLESQGHILRGTFREPGKIDWCERRLLVRIHKMTLDELRRQISPVSPEVFLSFLTEHQALTPKNQHEGKQGLLKAITQLQGFEAAAGSLEQEILASRVHQYEPQWLDELCLSGMVAWGRLRPMERDEDDKTSPGGMTRVVPLSLTLRADLSWLLPEHRQSFKTALRANALSALESLENFGAQFFDELSLRTGLLTSQLEEALGELCRLGLAAADGFSAIRPFISRNRKAVERAQRGLSRRYQKTPTYAAGGRWAVFPPKLPALEPEKRLEHWAWLLLSRYGVIFRDLLQRETAAPTWGELVRVYRTLEARGEIRGGQFVAGGFGEQFALPEVIEHLRRIRDRGAGGPWLIIAAADPLNLFGIITKSNKIPANRATMLVLQDGKLLGIREGTEVTFFEDNLTAELKSEIMQSLQLSGFFRAKLISEQKRFSQKIS